MEQKINIDKTIEELFKIYKGSKKNDKAIVFIPNHDGFNVYEIDSNTAKVMLGMYTNTITKFPSDCCDTFETYEESLEKALKEIEMLNNKLRERNEVWVVKNINGNIIGVAETFGKALLIYEARYGDTPDNTSDRIFKFELNKLQYD